MGGPSKDGPVVHLVQSDARRELWIYAALFACSAKTFPIVDEDSAYNKRHMRGHFKGLQI